jgi:hypothetical protein
MSWSRPFDDPIPTLKGKPTLCFVSVKLSSALVTTLLKPLR